jgi:Xaa-Pro aminopeptidase
VLEVRDFAERELIPGITRRAWATRVKEYMYTVCKKLQLEDIDKHTAITNPYFPHSIGHFLGLDTHDVGDSDMPLAPGMILTIEP